MRRVAIALLIVLTTACAGGESSESDGGEATPMTRTPPPRESLTLSSQQPVQAGDQLAGRLGADAVEGGCAYLEADDGTRYEVVYPMGWQVRLSPLALIDPAGEVVAEAGDTITVRGGIADDMASVCQIGPIFRAAEVEQ